MSSEAELKKRIEELEKEVEEQKKAVDDAKKASEAIVACLTKENDELTQTVRTLDVDVKRLREENLALQDHIQELQHRLDKAHLALNAANQSEGKDATASSEHICKTHLHTLYNTRKFSLVEEPTKNKDGDEDGEVKALLESPDIKGNADLLNAFDLITHRSKPTDKLVQLLGADVDRCLGSKEMTPLMYACYFGNLFAYEALIHAGARCGLRGAGENTLLHYAVMSGESMLAFSISMMHAKMHEVRNSDGETPLHIAVRTGRRDIVRFLAKDKFDVRKVTTATDGSTPLHYAAALGDSECTKLLLDRFYEVPDTFGNTALHSAVTMPPETMPLSQSALEERTKVAEMLIGSGKFDINAKNNDGDTPLHLACMLGYPPLVKLLCENKADISAVNSRSLQPLHIASASNAFDCCKELISRGAKADGIIKA